jgi:hypothetical protein
MERAQGLEFVMSSGSTVTHRLVCKSFIWNSLAMEFSFALSIFLLAEFLQSINSYSSFCLSDHLLDKLTAAALTAMPLPNS